MMLRAVHTVIATGAALLIVGAAATPAAAGIDWFQIGISSGGVHLSLGASDYWVWDDGWSNPSWSIDFHTTLAGYGEWMWVDGLGQVWRPYVAASWSPYSHGRWVHTTYGWTWIAYEPWGYVPHHFGHWARTHMGWVWRPGYTYSPANVVWVRTGGYVGWYASPPSGWSHYHRGYHRGWDRGYHHGHRDGYRHGYGHGYEDGWRDAMYANYVDWNHFGSDNIARHIQPRSHVERIVNRRSVERMSVAPRRQDVERITGQRVRSVPVETRRMTVDSRDVQMVRPEGVRDSIERHARPTAERALAPSVSRRLSNPSELVRRQPEATSPTHDRGGTIRGGGDRGADRPTGTIRSGDRSSVSRYSQERSVTRSPSSRGSISSSESTDRSRRELVWPGSRSSEGSLRSDRSTTGSRSGRTPSAQVPSRERSSSSRDRVLTPPSSQSPTERIERSAPSRGQLRSSGRSYEPRSFRSEAPQRSVAPQRSSRAPERSIAPRSATGRSQRSVSPQSAGSTSSRSVSPRRAEPSQPRASASRGSGSQPKQPAASRKTRSSSDGSGSSSQRPRPRGN